MTTFQLSDEQREIVELLCAELGELLAIDTAALELDDVAEQHQVLHEYSIQCDHISNALELSGLTGLAQVAKLIVCNFNTLSERDTPLDSELAEILPSWPVFLLNYLHQLIDEEDPATINDMLDFMSNPCWPLPLSTDEKSSLSETLSNTEFVSDDDVQYPTEATEDMVSMEVPRDVRKELLDGLLIELPEQTRNFEESINQYVSSGNVGDLSQAQRIAHTIKGAANVVGIKGVANLMHYMEDLLETAAKRQHTLPPKFDDVLIESSDMLATMAEYLGGMGSKPDGVRQVLQLVLDWMPRLKKAESSDVVDLENVDQQLSGDSAEESADPIFDNLDFDSYLDGPASIDDLDPGLREAVESEFSESVKDANSTRVTQVKEESPTATDSSEITESSIATDKPSGESASAPATDEEAQDEDEDDKHFLNLKEKTAQQLLRITGESQIANTQVMAQVDAMAASLQLAERYHRQIKHMASELEALVQTQGALRSASLKYAESELDPLEMDRYSELHTFSHQLLELTTDSYEAVGHIEEQVAELSAIAYTQKQLNADNQQLLLALRMVSVDTMEPRFNRCVRQACRLTGKTAKLIIEGGSLQIDSRVLNRIADPIMHLLRNAVDHGISDPAVIDQSQSDEASCVIRLSFRQKGETISVDCSDNGSGLDYEHIRSKAIRLGLLDESQQADANLLNQIIFLPGFSTRENVSQTSGRGIGLDAVTAEVRELKGNVTVSSSEDQGTCFSITVPTSILTGHALIVRTNHRGEEGLVSLVSRSIEQVVYLEQEQLNSSDDEIIFNYQGEKLAVYPLNDLINKHQSSHANFSALVICRKPDNNLVAVGVESIIASQDLVIKPLNKYVYHPPGVVGATILGDGTVSPVVDLQELPGLSMSAEEMALLKSQRAKLADMDNDRYKEPPIALIVDDSLSARRSLSQFVSDMGMEVRTAKDGFEAISVVNEKKPALMLVDLEMPRMNGLELTAHLRADEATRDIPIVMITSRSAQKHRDMAEKAGVDDYLNKPWSEEDLTGCIQQHISIA